MQPGDVLAVFVQLSVVLAGFAGVVAAFGASSSRELLPRDRHRIINLLLSSLLPFMLCLFAIVLLSWEPVPQKIWVWSSTSYLVVIGTWRIHRVVQVPKIPARHVKVFWSLTAISAVVILIQIYNVFGPGEASFYLLGIGVQLVLASIQFFSLVVSQTEPAA